MRLDRHRGLGDQPKLAILVPPQFSDFPNLQPYWISLSTIARDASFFSDKGSAKLWGRLPCYHSGPVLLPLDGFFLDQIPEWNEFPILVLQQIDTFSDVAVGSIRG